MLEKINLIRVVKLLSLLSCFVLLIIACKSATGPSSSISKDIIGDWEGCDGRVVRFGRLDRDTITGRYTRLGGLKQYGFEQNEIGYKVIQQRPGIYTGQVKWRTTSGGVSWKNVTISIEGDRYSDTSSDGCAKEMIRVKVTN